MRGRIEAASKGSLRGWIWDPSQPDVRISAEIAIDGALVGNVVAQRRRADLVKAGIGDGAHAFDLPLPLGLCDGRQHRIVLRGFREGVAMIADTRTLVVEQVNPTLTGKLEGVRRGKLIGWVWDKAQPDARVPVEMRIGGKAVVTVLADRLRADLIRSGIGDGKHAFEVPVAALAPAEGKTVELTVVVQNTVGEVTLGKLTVSDAAPKQGKSTPTKSAAKDAEPAATSPQVANPPFEGPAAPKAKAVELPAAPKPNATAAAEPPPAPMPTVKELLGQAGAAETAGKLAEASELLDRILTSKPKEVDALFRRARVALALSDIAAAKDFASRVIEIKKDHPKALVTLARAADLERQWALGLEYWSRVPASDSAYRERLLKSARLMVTLERPLEALPLLKEAVALKPNDLSARRTLMQLALDVDDLACALEQHAALEAKASDGVPPKAPPALKPSTHSLAAIRRHKGALTHAGNPVALAVGNELTDLLLAKRYVGVLAAHFGTPVDLLVPEVTPMARSFFEGSPEVRNLFGAAECDLGYEVAFVLPEFSLLAEEEVPAAKLRYVFTETHTLSGGTPAIRHRAYAAWLNELTGISVAAVDRMDVRLGQAASAPSSGPVVLVRSSGRQAWTVYQDLAKLLKGRKQKVASLQLNALPTGAEAVQEMLAVLTGAIAVVCGNEAVAGLAGALGVPVLYLTAADSGASVRVLAPQAVIFRGGEGCSPCAETFETRWKAAVGACECLGRISTEAVLQALLPLLPATSAKPVAAAEMSLEAAQ